MLRRDAGQSISYCDGSRKRYFYHLGRGFLPLLAVMFLAAPQLAFAQGSLAVTVDPRTLEIDEGENGNYTIELNTEPSEDVKITVVGAPTAAADVTVDSDSPGADTTDGTLVFTFTADSAPDQDDGNWDDSRTVTVSTEEDADAVSETMTLTHTATMATMMMPWP